VATKQEILAALQRPGLIAVVRARAAEQVVPLAEALLRGGVRAIEVTMTTPNAIEAIRACSKQLPAEALIGVGTVLKVETCQAAIEAGAQFVVSPIMRPAIAEAAHRAGKPVMLGAFTPTEAQAAYEAGSDFVKLFPADMLGPGYIKAIRAPLPHLQLVPTGGVTLANIAEFFQAGCPAVGIGSSLVSARILEQNDWAELEALARKFVAAVGRGQA
jgi:2-dehydro-3-deoxyphosphogluconate aldolase/(4S)-4-hydroxy-2-oxoglutarate aldolase